MIHSTRGVEVVEKFGRSALRKWLYNTTAEGRLVIEGPRYWKHSGWGGSMTLRPFTFSDSSRR